MRSDVVGNPPHEGPQQSRAHRRTAIASRLPGTGGPAPEPDDVFGPDDNTPRGIPRRPFCDTSATSSPLHHLCREWEESLTDLRRFVEGRGQNATCPPHVMARLERAHDEFQRTVREIVDGPRMTASPCDNFPASSLVTRAEPHYGFRGDDSTGYAPMGPPVSGHESSRRLFSLSRSPSRSSTHPSSSSSASTSSSRDPSLTRDAHHFYTLPRFNASVPAMPLIGQAEGSSQQRSHSVAHAPDGSAHRDRNRVRGAPSQPIQHHSRHSASLEEMHAPRSNPQPTQSYGLGLYSGATPDPWPIGFAMTQRRPTPAAPPQEMPRGRNPSSSSSVPPAFGGPPQIGRGHQSVHNSNYREPREGEASGSSRRMNVTGPPAPVAPRGYPVSFERNGPRLPAPHSATADILAEYTTPPSLAPTSKHLPCPACVENRFANASSLLAHVKSYERGDESGRERNVIGHRNLLAFFAFMAQKRRVACLSFISEEASHIRSMGLYIPGGLRGCELPPA